MTFSSFRLALLAGLALPLGLATASLAQDATPAPPTQGAAGTTEHHWDPARMRAHIAEHLSAALQLQPGQQAALAAYLDSMKPPGDRADRTGRGPDEMASLSTPERLDRMMARFDEMHVRMSAHVQATKQFYAQLTPSQQKAFDAMSPMMMHHFGGGHHGMMGPPAGGDGPGHEMGPGGQLPG